MTRRILCAVLLCACATGGGIGGRIETLRARVEVVDGQCPAAEGARAELDEIEARWVQGLDEGRFESAERRAEQSLKAVEAELKACRTVSKSGSRSADQRVAITPPKPKARSKKPAKPAYADEEGFDFEPAPAPSRRKSSDRDGDGLLDDIDQCPDNPEDRDGFQDSDGCPDPDNDRDGILDFSDKCPNEPEDSDGFEDQDGCPESDNDRDGVPDSVDACPLGAGTAAKRGCP